MTNIARSSAGLSIASSSNIERTPGKGQLRLVTTRGAECTVGEPATDGAPAPRRSLLATVGRLIGPKAPAKTGERVNADFWDSRLMS